MSGLMLEIEFDIQDSGLLADIRFGRDLATAECLDTKNLQMRVLAWLHRILHHISFDYT